MKTLIEKIKTEPVANFLFIDSKSATFKTIDGNHSVGAIFGSLKKVKFYLDKAGKQKARLYFNLKNELYILDLFREHQPARSILNSLCSAPDFKEIKIVIYTDRRGLTATKTFAGGEYLEWRFKHTDEDKDEKIKHCLESLLNGKNPQSVDRKELTPFAIIDDDEPEIRDLTEDDEIPF